MSKLTRRNFLGAAAVMAGGLTGLQKVVGAELHGAADRSKSDPGPSNPALDGQNPDSIWPPDTDSKSLVRWIPRAALAHGRRMGHHALRKRTDYRHRSGRQKFRRRRGQK